ncbi:MAG: ATP-dependent Clp protease ATP-binding subunit [Bacilli bacterium]|jgi:ATP-dependent Clp protease ATP-binding subunit ClpC|nr:ATP-dependent Clp protease ATP-binding subunit [Bacilli bacterium]
MENNINGRIKRILEYAEQEMLDLNHPYVGSEHLLLSLLEYDRTKKILNKYNLTYDNFKETLIRIIGKSNIKSTYILYTPLLKLIIKRAIERDGEDANELSLLKELISSDDGIAVRIMLELGCDLDTLYGELVNTHSYLDEIGVNMMRSTLDYPLIGREKEISSMLEILLRKNKNNPILVGYAGVGKTAIVYELAKRIKEGHVPESLMGKEIYMLDMASLLSNTKYRGEFETKINNLIKEAISKENIILFIDEIHTIVRTGGGEGSCDAANILKPYLASDKIKLIGATTLKEYDEYISSDSALSRRFARIHVKEPTESETLEILKGVKESYESYHKVKLEDKTLELIVKYASKYITNNQNPDKSLEVLDCLLSRVNLNMYENNYVYAYNEFLKNKDYKNALNVRMQKKTIEEKDIISVIENLANIKILEEENYQNLVSILDKKIYGQDLTKLKELLHKKFINNKVSMIEIKGPKGVGKTYTAKLIAETLNYNLIELDMKEFSSPTSINRLIGSDPGYVGYDSSTILDKIKYNPYSLILLKNVEEAALNVLELFSSISEKGYLTDKYNNKINFNFTLIIKTNNCMTRKIGYDNLNEQNSGIVYYNLISKENMKKYLLDNKLSEEYLLDLEDETTFTNLHLINDILYINP